MKDQTPPEDANSDSPNKNAGSMTRRKAIVGGVSGLLLGALSAKNAVAQGVPPPSPLLRLGGLCEGTLMMLKPADGAAFMEKMLAKSTPFQTLRNHFVSTAGMAFILSRAKVFMYVAPTLDSDAIVSPNILGILPSFKPVNPSDAFHEAAGIVVHNNGCAMATSVRVAHNPFVVTEFRSHEVDPDNLTQIITQTISPASLESLSVQAAAAAMGAPKIFERNIDPQSPTPSQADSTAMVTIALQAILKDSYARPLYPQEGLNSLLGQASLAVKLSSVHFQRYSGALSKSTWCSCTCCNGCTTTSLSLKLIISA